MAYTRLNPEYSGMNTLTTRNLSSGTIQYAKYGNIVIVTFDSLKPSQTGATEIGTLPEGYCPASGYQQPYLRDQLGYAYQCWVGPNGVIAASFTNTGYYHAGFGIWMTS